MKAVVEQHLTCCKIKSFYQCSLVDLKRAQTDVTASIHRFVPHLSYEVCPVSSQTINRSVVFISCDVVYAHVRLRNAMY